MTWKKFWKESFFGLILKNVLLAGIIVVILAWVTFYFINVYAEHGVTEYVPDVRGAYFEEAEVMLRAQKLYPYVIDSVYDRTKQLGTVIEQVPAPNATIKHNRPVYLIINSQYVKKVPLPGILDFSSRQASAIIKAAGLDVESIQYAPSEYKDLVIDVKYKGESIYPNYLIPEGESVVLIVGSGLGNESIIPNLKGLSLEEARIHIIEAYFILGATNYDDTPPNESSSEDYIVYRQHPADGDIAPSGSRVDIWLSTDRTLLDKTTHDKASETNEEEEFF